MSISSSYTNPATVSDATKATFTTVPTSVPSSPNLADINVGGDSQYITECKAVTNVSTTGLNVQFTSTLYYLFT